MEVKLVVLSPVVLNATDYHVVRVVASKAPSDAVGLLDCGDGPLARSANTEGITGKVPRVLSDTRVTKASTVALTDCVALAVGEWQVVMGQRICVNQLCSCEVHDQLTSKDSENRTRRDTPTGGQLHTWRSLAIWE